MLKHKVVHVFIGCILTFKQYSSKSILRFSYFMSCGQFCFMKGKKKFSKKLQEHIELKNDHFVASEFSFFKYFFFLDWVNKCI